MSRVSPDRIAIAVPCFNEAGQAARLGEAVARLGARVLLAVDDGSTDGTAEALEAAGFEVLRHDGNQGLGAARNTLWREAEKRGCEAVAFLDADVQPPPDYLTQVCELLGPGVAGVGGRNVDRNPEGFVDAWRGRFWAQDVGPAPLLDAPMLVGACATYRIRALRDVGGFHPGFRTHGEDVEIGRRLRAGGHRLRYEPSLEVEHRRVDDPAALVRSCYLHCREGMRATRSSGEGPPGPGRLVIGLAKKAAWAPAAALVKRRDLREAALGLAACSAGLAGYAVGWAGPIRG